MKDVYKIIDQTLFPKILLGSKPFFLEIQTHIH